MDSSTAAATDCLHELLVLLFWTFFSLAFLPGILGKTSKKSLSDCLLLPNHSRVQKCLHPHHDDDDDEVLCCRLTNTFAVHKEPIILQQVQVFLFFSFVFSLVCNSGSCNWGLRSSSSIICMCDPGAGWSSLMLCLSLIMGSFCWNILPFFYHFK